MSIQIPSVPQSTITNEYDGWHKYWQAQGQPWRTEPEIDAQRQEELEACCAIVPDVQQGCYPFHNLADKLTRADVEWLLATRVSNSILQNGKHHREYPGLDLRGADLSKVDLRGLPLIAIRGGLSEENWCLATIEQRDLATIRLERADLRGAHLERAILRGAHLEGADLRSAHLEGADLREAHLEGKGHSLKPLPPADLRMAFFDSTTHLENIILGDEEHGVVRVADIHWNNVNLASAAWSKVDILGDESDARQWKDLDSYRAAVRANRQLAAALHAQGLNEEANHFAYRAQVNRRVILLRQMILPLVLRLIQQPQMPSPLVFRRLEQWWQSQGPPHNVLPATLLRMTVLLLVLFFITLWQPLALLGILLLCTVPFALLYVLLRRRARLPHPYQPAQDFLLPQGLLPQKQRLQQKQRLLLNFLLGKPVAAVTQSLTAKWHFPLLLLFLLIVDNTLVCCGRYLFSLFFDALIGYGYKPARSVAWYVVTVFGFAPLYALLGHLPPLEAFVLSITSFHGRGFFPASNTLSNPLIVLGAVEAVVGLVIEISLIVTFMKSRLP